MALHLCLTGLGVEACNGQQAGSAVAAGGEVVLFHWRLQNVEAFNYALAVRLEIPTGAYDIGDMHPGQVVEGDFALITPDCAGSLYARTAAVADNMDMVQAIITAEVFLPLVFLSACLMGVAVDVCNGVASSVAAPGSTPHFWASLHNPAPVCATNVRVAWPGGGTTIDVLEPGGSRSYEFDVTMPTNFSNVDVYFSGEADNSPLAQADIAITVTGQPVPEISARLCFVSCRQFMGLISSCPQCAVSGSAAGCVQTLRGDTCTVTVQIRNVGTGKVTEVYGFIDNTQIGGPVDLEVGTDVTFTATITVDRTRLVKGGAIAANTGPAWAFINMEVFNEVPGPKLSVCLAAGGQQACNGQTAQASVAQPGNVEFAATISNPGQFTAHDVVVSTNAGSTRLGDLSPGQSQVVRGTVAVNERTAIQATAQGQNVPAVQATVMVSVGAGAGTMSPAMLLVGALGMGAVALMGPAGLKIAKKGVLL